MTFSVIKFDIISGDFGTLLAANHKIIDIWKSRSNLQQTGWKGNRSRSLEYQLLRDVYKYSFSVQPA